MPSLNTQFSPRTVIYDIFLALKSIVNYLARPIWVDAMGRVKVSPYTSGGINDTITVVTTVATVTDITRLNNIGASAGVQQSLLYLQAYSIERSNWANSVRNLIT